MAVQVNHTSDASGVESAARSVVTQQGNGFAACGLSRERLVHGVIAGFTNLSKVGLRHTVRTVFILGSSGVFSQVSRRIGVECTARDLNRCLCGVIDFGRIIFTCTQRTVNGAARDGHLCRLAFGAVVSHRLNIAVYGASADVQIGIASFSVRPRRNIAVDDRIVLYVGIQPVLNRIAVLGVDHAALHIKSAKVNFNCDEIVLRKGTTGNGHDRMRFFITVVADANKGRALRTVSRTAVVPNGAAVEQQKTVLALNVNNVMGRNTRVLCSVLTHDGARLSLTGVLDSDPGVVNRQCRAGFDRTTVKGVAVQVELNRICRNGNVLARVSEQLHRCIARCGIDCGL